MMPKEQPSFTSVADALAGLRRLKGVPNKPSGIEIAPTGGIAAPEPREAPIPSALTSDAIADEAATQVEPAPLEQQPAEPASSRAVVDLRHEVADLKTKTWAGAVTISLALAGIVIAIVLYLHEDLKESLRDLTSTVTAHFDDLTEANRDIFRRLDILDADRVRQGSQPTGS
jgi:hypothetical protein